MTAPGAWTRGRAAFKLQSNAPLSDAALSAGPTPRACLPIAGGRRLDAFPVAVRIRRADARHRDAGARLLPVPLLVVAIHDTLLCGASARPVDGEVPADRERRADR